jgi:thioesterase domain-containing protein
MDLLHPDMGSDKWVKGKLSFLEIASDHHSMMKNPQVKELAKLVGDILKGYCPF